MTPKQFVLRLFYPFLMKFAGRLRKKKGIVVNEKKILPVLPIYNLEIALNSGSKMRLEITKGKKILFVNTASNCGYTNQYAELQELYKKFTNKLEIIGFPANDFKEQEKGSDEEIASFCQLNFGVSFPLAKKSTVVKQSGQNNIFKWLTDKNSNGWNDKPPVWNFSKYLVDEQGTLTHYFDPSISPLSEEVINAIHR